MLRIIFISAPFLNGCGSAEAVEQYAYSTSVPNLNKTVVEVLRSNKNPKVIWDTLDIVSNRVNVDSKDKSGHVKADTFHTSRLKGQFYFITIKEKAVAYNYMFTYLGSQGDWQTSTSSTICIDALWNNNNNGLDLRQGENVEEFSSDEAELAKSIFEKEFLSQIDKSLKLKHATGRSFWQ